MIGIVINPYSGKDVRRITGEIETVSNETKVRAARRIIKVLLHFGVKNIFVAMDAVGIHLGVVSGFEKWVEVVEFEVNATEEDTRKAMKIFLRKGANFVIIVGGDGTFRVAFESFPDAIFVPLAYGTNNTTSIRVEPVAAALALVYACKREPIVEERKHLSVSVGAKKHVALAEAVIYDSPFVGARSLYDPRAIRRAVVVKGLPGDIGIAGLVGLTMPVGWRDPFGVDIVLGKGKEVAFPIEPGRMAKANVEKLRVVRVGETVSFPAGALTLALDGERVVEAKGRVSVRVIEGKPKVLSVRETLERAVSEGFFQNF